MIEDIVKILSSRIKNNNLSIDSLYIEKNSNIYKIIDNDNLHELRSCTKLLVSMAAGIAIKQGLLSLDEHVYPYLEKYITNKSNISKIKKWTNAIFDKKAKKHVILLIEL